MSVCVCLCDCRSEQFKSTRVTTVKSRVGGGGSGGRGGGEKGYYARINRTDRTEEVALGKTYLHEIQRFVPPLIQTHPGSGKKDSEERRAE